MFSFFCLSKRHKIICKKTLTWNCAHHHFTVPIKCKVQSFNYDPISLRVNLCYSLYSELLHKVIHLELWACFWSHMPICQENFTLIHGVWVPIVKVFASASVVLGALRKDPSPFLQSFLWSGVTQCLHNGLLISGQRLSCKLFWYEYISSYFL